MCLLGEIGKLARVLQGYKLFFLLVAISEINHAFVSIQLFYIKIWL